jgi:hypothetical protein
MKLRIYDHNIVYDPKAYFTKGFINLMDSYNIVCYFCKGESCQELCTRYKWR